MHQYILNDFPSARQHKQTKWWKRDDFYQATYLRIKERIPVEDGLALIGQSCIMHGAKITTMSRRLKLVQVKEHKGCVCCGAKLTHFNVERQRSDKNGCFCLAPYATMENGHEVLLTWDHIIPRALGGSDHGDNSQLMCMKCNNEKGSKADELLDRIIIQAPHLISQTRLHKALEKNKNNASLVKMLKMIINLINEMEK